MKKGKILLLTALCLTSTAGNSAVVPRDKAAVTASRFLKSHGINISSRELLARDSHDTRSADGTSHANPYHIFNAEGGGFVIVSGDDRARAILAYSPTGTAGRDLMPDGCRALLESYADEIATLDAVTPTSDAITYPADIIAPMITTRWDQGIPYNSDCPIDNKTGMRSLTGCGATAMAQIMRYHRHPSLPTGLLTYTDAPQAVDRTIDFDAMEPFDWDNMTDSYGQTSTTSQCTAVSRLMMATGYASKTRYGSETSITYLRDNAEALYTYFGYDRDIHRYEREFMSDSEWIDMIVGELRAGRPVLYEGHAPTGGVGHTFICDGYDGDGYFHFNWGWSGTSDGYYSLSALTPPQQGSGGMVNDYTRSQIVTANIIPAGQPGAGAQCTGLIFMERLYIMDGTSYIDADTRDIINLATADGLGFFFYAKDRAYTDFNGEICAAIIDDGTVTPLSTSSISLSIDVWGRVTLPIDLSSLPNDKTVQVGFFHRRDPSQPWTRIPARLGQASSCRLTMSDGHVIITPDTPSASMHLVGDLSSDAIYSGYPASWDMEVCNTGTERFEGYAGLMASNIATGDTRLFISPLFCVPGETANVGITAEAGSLSAGEYLLTPFVSKAANPSPDAVTTIGDAVPVSVIFTPTLVMMPGNYSTVYTFDRSNPTLATTVHNMSSDTWTGTLTGFISRSNDDGDIATISAFATLSPGATDVTFDASETDLPEGTDYRVEWCLGGTERLHVSSGLLVVTDSRAAVDTIDGDDIRVTVNDAAVIITGPGRLTVTVTDITGSAVTSVAGEDTVSIPRHTLAHGAYILAISSSNTISTIKIVL
ncbi:MAG: thiol protease/hemagglutinin PrtT [Pseudoflavonifractor sp.]|nr:thiol protease/hemagglutinin PrtT [Pseudoflavonifractor sp.]